VEIAGAISVWPLSAIDFVDVASQIAKTLEEILDGVDELTSTCVRSFQSIETLGKRSEISHRALA
jgi:hypothetical protein